MTETITYQTDDILREHLLTDDRLKLAEMGYPGAVRVLAAGRYHARVDVEGIGAYQFRIRETGHLDRELVSTMPEAEPLLGALVWHRAAEAMLAVRRGHMEARLNKAYQKPKQDV